MIIEENESRTIKNVHFLLNFRLLFLLGITSKKKSITFTAVSFLYQKKT